MQNTNFALWQDGSWTESVRLWPIGKDVPTVANLTQNGWETRLPLLTGTADGKAGKLSIIKTGVALSRKSILIKAYGENPDGGGAIIRLWKQAGISGKCIVNLGTGKTVKAVIPIDHRGNIKGKRIVVSNGVFSFYLGKYAPASFLLVY